jgi:CRISPR-associated protein Cas5d
MNPAMIRVRIAGNFACFTRPETKVERFSYPVMTPSAARNILDAICWRPEMRWVVTRIAVLKPIRYMSVLRNEIQNTISPASVKRWMLDLSRIDPIVAGGGQGTDCTQRNTTLLCNVAYWIDAYPHVFEICGKNTQEKYIAMMQRRVERGQCFQRPYLGCREFAADFSSPLPDDHPIENSLEIGRMLYDIAFLQSGNRAVFFEANLVKGILETDPEQAISDKLRREEVLGCSYRR